MSGGSASANILQMVRSWQSGDDRAFVGAAMMLARQTKTESVRNGIMSVVSQGVRRPGAAPSPAHTPFQPLAQQPPTSPMLEQLEPISFAELLLDAPLQAQLDELVIELEYRAALADRKLRARNRLLFWGSPGNGKTAASAALGRALGAPVYGVSLPKLISKYIGETGQNLGQLFDAIRPSSIVVFDEIDAIGSSRGSTDQTAGKEHNSIVNTMLTLLDRNKKGVLVATTNRPDLVDPALRRRFDEELHFPDPSWEQMISLMQKLCGEYGVPQVDVSNCANFDGVTKTVQREARRHVMRELLAADEAEKEEDGEEEDK